MSIRVVLAPLFGKPADRAGLDAACRLARRCDSHLTALFVRPLPADMVPYLGEGVSPEILAELMRASRAELDRQAGVARQQFEASRRDAGFEAASPTEWLEADGRPVELVARFGRVADLIVLAGGDRSEDDRRRAVIEAALLQTGRPVLLVPQKWTEAVAGRVAIAWHGRAEAARAVALALPLLETAQEVHILTAATSRTSFDTSQDLATYLERHGLACARHLVTVAGETVGAALMRQAAVLAADLVVMGGYGRSRLAELVLGGVTRHVITHLERPVLLAH
jgi:nucleotide-binding universal stress UspA family protein